MKSYESGCRWFLNIEGSVSRAVFLLVKPTFDFVALMSTRTFVM